jgi:hypothetical protein
LHCGTNVTQSWFPFPRLGPVLGSIGCVEEVKRRRRHGKGPIALEWHQKVVSVLVPALAKIGSFAEDWPEGRAAAILRLLCVDPIPLTQNQSHGGKSTQSNYLI